MEITQLLKSLTFSLKTCFLRLLFNTIDRESMIGLFVFYITKVFSCIFSLLHLLANGYEILFIFILMCIHLYTNEFEHLSNVYWLLRGFFHCKLPVHIFFHFSVCIFVIEELDILSHFLPVIMWYKLLSVAGLFFKQLYWDIICIPYNSLAQFIHKVNATVTII